MEHPCGDRVVVHQFAVFEAPLRHHEQAHALDARRRVHDARAERRIELLLDLEPGLPRAMADPEQLQQLTPEQLNQLRENMRKHAQGLNGPQQPGEGEGEGDGENGDGEDDNEDGEGEGPGQGGIDRGPGHAPNPLGRTKEDTGAGKHEGLKSDDQSRSLPGDLLETSDAKHDVDETQRGPSEGGSTSPIG